MSRFIEGLEARQMLSVAPMASHFTSPTALTAGESPALRMSPAVDNAVCTRFLRVYTVVKHKQSNIAGATVTATWQYGKDGGNLTVAGVTNDQGLVLVSGHPGSHWIYTVNADGYLAVTKSFSGPKKPDGHTDSIPLKPGVSNL